MLRHNLVIIYRNVIRFKTSFFINLVSLSIALTCVLMIYLWVADEIEIDSFHEKNDRLFQVLQNMPGPAGISTTDATPGILVNTLKTEIPGIVDAVVEYPGRGSKGIISYADKHLNADELYVSARYLSFFSYPLIRGEVSQVLAGKYNVVISDELAQMLFGNIDTAVGKFVQWNQGNLTELKGEYIVSGVFKKPGTNSSTQFDLLFSYEHYTGKVGSILGLDRWTNSDPRTYVLLEEQTDPDLVNQQIHDLIRQKSRKHDDQLGTLFLQKFSDRYLYNKFENGQQTGGRIEYVRLFSAIAILILAIACINVTNLSTARAARRSKEVGVKKVIGADRRTIFIQFILEAVIITCLALSVAFVLSEGLLPRFSELTGKQLQLEFTMSLLSAAMMIGLVTALAAGSYPAVFLSKITPIGLLHSTFSPPKGHIATLRNALMIFQFSVTIILLVAVVVTYQQMDLIRSKDIGYDRRNVIHFVTKGNLLNGNAMAFLNDVKNIAGVEHAANYQSLIITKNRRGIITDIDWEGKGGNHRLEMSYLRGGYDFVETLGIRLVNGRAFSRDFAGEENKIVINEAAAAQLGMGDPVGKNIRIEGEDMQIIGIVRNFHLESFYSPIRPCVIFLKTGGDHIMIRLAENSKAETLEALAKYYSNFNDGLAFEYEFLESDYNTLYSSENRVGELTKYFTAVAILISCMGLYGLVSFLAERRQKEMSIRKIFGSGTIQMAWSLSSSFFKMLMISFLVAFPVSYALVASWLEHFAFRIDLKLSFFLCIATGMIVLICLTIFTQVHKATQVNPAKILRAD